MGSYTTYCQTASSPHHRGTPRHRRKQNGEAAHSEGSLRLLTALGKGTGIVGDLPRWSRKRPEGCWCHRTESSGVTGRHSVGFGTSSPVEVSQRDRVRCEPEAIGNSLYVDSNRPFNILRSSKMSASVDFIVNWSSEAATAVSF